MIVYLPILTLEGVEGKLFRPMALTVIFALVGSMVLSLTLMPVLASLRPAAADVGAARPLLDAGRPAALPARSCGSALRLRRRRARRRRGRRWSPRRSLAPHLGSEFVPRLCEGAIVINTVRLAERVAWTSRSATAPQIEQRAARRSSPTRSTHVWSRTGTAEVATDPMGVELTDVFITLKPREQWTRATTQAELVARDGRASSRRCPGMRLVFTQPIEMRINEMVAGVRADLGDQALRRRLRRAARRRRARSSAVAEGDPRRGRRRRPSRSPASRCSQIKVDRRTRSPATASRRATVLDVVEAHRRASRSARSSRASGASRSSSGSPERYRDDPEALGAILVADADRRAHAARRGWRDIEVDRGPVDDHTASGASGASSSRPTSAAATSGSFVAEAQRAHRRARSTLPAGYYVQFGGQFEHLERARSAAADRRAGRARADLRAALPHLPPRRSTRCASSPACRSRGVGGIVALWLRGHAVLDLGRRRLHRPVRRRGARRHDPRLDASASCSAAGRAAATRRSSRPRERGCGRC